MAFPPVQEAKKIYTRDDLRALYGLPGNEDKQFELIDGEIHEVPAASFLHGVIAKIIMKLLMLYAEPAGLGEVFPDGTVTICRMAAVCSPMCHLSRLIAFRRITES